MNISFYQTRENIQQSIPQYSSKLMYSNKRVSSLSRKNDHERKSKDTGGILFHVLYRWLHHLPFKIMAAEPLEQSQSIHSKVSAALWDVSSGKPPWNSINLIGKMFNSRLKWMFTLLMNWAIFLMHYAIFLNVIWYLQVITCPFTLSNKAVRKKNKGGKKSVVWKNNKIWKRKAVFSKLFELPIIYVVLGSEAPCSHLDFQSH